MKTDNLQNCEHHVLICVKSKHGCKSGMMSWTDVGEMCIWCGKEKDCVGYFSGLVTKGFCKSQIVRWGAILF